MDRRQFLHLGAATGIASAFPVLFSQSSFAATDSGPNYFVQIRMGGGWDVTLGIDPWLNAKPKESDMFLEYDPANVLRVGNLAFGPSMMPLQAYANDICVINGVFMNTSDNGHEAAALYALSGTVDQKWGSLPIELAECRPARVAGVLQEGRTHRGNRSTLLTSSTSISSFSNIDLNQTNPFSEGQNSLLTRIEIEIRSKPELIQKLNATIGQLQSQFGKVENSHFVAAAFAAGLADIASYDITDNYLDTHADHPGRHLSLQQAQWQSIADLFAAFRAVPLSEHGPSLFDRTTFFITSEFARTPALDASRGKNHNPFTNSVMLLGPAFKKNVTLGGSHLITSEQSRTRESYHIATPIDFETGRTVNSRLNTMIIKPEHVAATVVEALGISRRRFASIKPSVPSLAKHLLRS